MLNFLGRLVSISDGLPPKMRRTREFGPAVKKAGGKQPAVKKPPVFIFPASNEGVKNDMRPRAAYLHSFAWLEPSAVGWDQEENCDHYYQDREDGSDKGTFKSWIHGIGLFRR